VAKAVKPTIRFAADFDAYKRELKKAIGQTDKFDRNLKNAGKNNGFKSIGKAAFGAAAGIGAVAIAGTELKKSVEETVNLAKATRGLQRATGLASEDASQLAAVLKVRNIGTDKAGRSFTALARQIEAAKTGTGAAAEQFRKLGVSQDTLRRGNFNQILLGISDGFAKLGDGTAKATAAQALFSRSSRDILPLLEGGSQKLREQLGLAPKLSEAQVKQSLAMVNAQRQVDLALLNVRTTLGTALMPVIADGANKLAKFVTQMKTGEGAGGEFAKKLREIWNAVKPAIEQLVNFGKAVFEFAAANPKLVKMAAYLGAIGLAVKGIKFASAISGLSSFLGMAKGLGAPLRKLFARSGTRAGAAFASEAAGTAAGNMAGSMAPGGVMGRMGGKNGRFAKWGRFAGRAAGVAFAAAMLFVIYEEIKALWNSNLINPQETSRQQDLRPGTKKFEEAKKFGTREGNRIRRDRDRRRARGSAVARGSARGVGGMRAPARANPERSWLAGYGNDIAAQLQLAEVRVSAAQKRLESLENATSGRKKSRTEKENLRELKRLANAAQREVEKLQLQIGRRDALADIGQQFKDFARGFADAYASGLERIQQARLSAAQKVSQQILDDQLKNLDEEQGQSEEARRLRELRAQQERDQLAREDEDYAENKKLLEDELARAIRNGNVRRQEELNEQIEELDRQRRDTLRSREIQDLAESLQRQRQVAQDEYQARVTAAQDYYDRQVIINQQLVDAYRANVEQQMELLRTQLETGQLNYADYNTRINELNAALTTQLNTELTTRANNERAGMAAQLGAYGSYVNSINAEFSRVMSTLPAPQIPEIPRITIDVFYNYLNPPPGAPAASPTPSPSAPAKKSSAQLTDWLSGGGWKQLGSPKSPSKASALAGAGVFAGWSANEIYSWSRSKSVASILKKRNRAIGRVSGGPLSRSSLTLVGETGPELIMGNRVISATRTNRTSAGNVTLNVYPQTTADDPVALARALGWQLATR